MPDLIRCCLGNPKFSTTADPYRETLTLTYSPLVLSVWLSTAGSCTSGHLPVIEQEEEIWHSDCELEAPPVWKCVSWGSEDKESKAERKLVSDAHCPLVV